MVINRADEICIPIENNVLMDNYNGCLVHISGHCTIETSAVDN